MSLKISLCRRILKLMWASGHHGWWDHDPTGRFWNGDDCFLCQTLWNAHECPVLWEDLSNLRSWRSNPKIPLLAPRFYWAGELLWQNHIEVLYLPSPSYFFFQNMGKKQTLHKVPQLLPWIFQRQPFFRGLSWNMTSQLRFCPSWRWPGAVGFIFCQLNRC